MTFRQFSVMVLVALAIQLAAPFGRAGLPRLLASFTASPQAWTAAFETNPANSDSVSQADDHMRQIKGEIRERLETEMDFGELGNVTTDTGRHLEGSARCFRQNTAPVIDGAITAACLAEADYDGNRGCDDGRCWIDADGPDNTGSTSDDNTLFVSVDSDSDGDADSWSAAPASLPANSIILWDASDTCPAGFAEATEFRNLTVRGADRISTNGDIPDSAGVTCTSGILGSGCSAGGGAGNYDDVLQIGEAPAHTHGIPTNLDSTPNNDGLKVPRSNLTTNATSIPSDANGLDQHHLHPLRTVLFCRKS